MSETRLERREARYELRASLRQITTMKRLRYCGLPLKDAVIVHRQEGTHYFSGRATCGSSFICPICSARIRHYRATEVSKAIVSALDKGMSVLFVTRTIPHSAADRLGVTLNLLAEGKRYVVNQTKVKEVRKTAGRIGGIAALEITYGLSGWHPHYHEVEIMEQELSLDHFATLSSMYYDYLDRFYTRHGFDGLSRHHGVHVEQVTIGGAALAAYVAKVQAGAAIQVQAAHELTRSDLKLGRVGSLTPFDILREFFATGDTEALRLWHEYEYETHGKSSIRFTQGLRQRLIPSPERPDEQLAALPVGGVNAVYFTSEFYHKIARVPGLEGKVLTALDTGGFAALVELLTVYHLDGDDGYYRIDTEQEGL